MPVWFRIVRMVLVGVMIVLVSGMGLCRRVRSGGGVAVPGMVQYLKLGGRDAGTRDPIRPDVVPPDRQTAQGSAQFLKGQACIDEGPKRHVACDARETVEIKKT